MKKWIVATMACAMLTLNVSVSAQAADQWSASQLDQEMLSSVFNIDTLDSRGVTILDETQLGETRGKLAPMLGFVMGVAALDLTLAGFYWGVYVPYYAKMSPSFSYQIP
tara:strand:- start:83 stop:409 length:327 start_codon:yes stop_codon:yes gene_type:complete